MGDLYYICKYTPLELLEAYGASCRCLDEMPEGFDYADQVAHPNLCGFGKTLLEAVYAGRVRELVLVNCCDTIRSVYDILEADGRLDFLYMLDMLRSGGSCSRKWVAGELCGLARAYGAYCGKCFDREAFQRAFHAPERQKGDYIAVLGARMGQELFEMVERAMPLPVRNVTCVHNRSVGAAAPPASLASCCGAGDPGDPDFNGLMEWYAGELLGQIPCMRMHDNSGRRQLYNDPSLKGIIYHTVKFCDFYSFEYAQLKGQSPAPLLKIESDYTVQSSGQLLTRLEAFAENLAPEEKKGGTIEVKKGYFAGIDSGSASTDAVILDREKQIVAGMIFPTGAGAAVSAERALTEALREAGLAREDIDALVTTGYGRGNIQAGDKSITEITCHARGAHYLDPSVRTVIDIGGQDSKVILLDEEGGVVNFVMNDKCAAGTGRFLEMMARTMEMNLEEMSETGLSYREDITISSMCTVFAESEVVSLIAQNKSRDDIVHGLDKAVAAKTASLASRAGGKAPYMMTGGVSKNRGVVKTLEEKLGTKILVDERAQLCGALGAALFAADMAEEAAEAG